MTQPENHANHSQALAQFAPQLLAWFDQHGRHDLPWQQDINPYRVWVSEIMLQQTQVITVIPYYQKFMQRFPSVEDLAAAEQEEVLAHWAGLGYYARGRNLHKSAQIIVEQFDGVFPSEFEQIVALPGIGRSTAGAILSISLGQRMAILDGNVKRVLSRYFAIEGWPGERLVEQQLWQLADQLTPQQRFADYTQAIMDLGATLCSRSKPNCEACPVNKNCQALAQQQVLDYPHKKPKKSKPTKQAWLLVLEDHQQRILFEKRQQKGIWGGLWSLPQFESKQALLEFLQSQRLTTQSLIEWPELKHSFSHYHLQIVPMHLPWLAQQVGDSKTSTKASEQAAEYLIDISDVADQSQWLSADQLLSGDFGLPAPIVKVLKNWTQRQS